MVVCEGRGRGPIRSPGSQHGFFRLAVKRLQKRDPTFPTLTPHGLRHVAAGLFVSAGANVKVVQRQLGHASAAMTLDTYADLFEEDLDALGSALGGFFGCRENVVKNSLMKTGFY